MCLYHAFLYYLQRDRFVLLYCHYLFSLVSYLIFQITTQHNSFLPPVHYGYFIADEMLILWMLISYVYFIAQVLEVDNKARIVKYSVLAFYTSIGLSLLFHLYKILFTDIDYLSRAYFFYSKLVLVTIAFIGLTGAAMIRKSVFVRIIIAGALIYAFFSFLTMISIYLDKKILGIREYQLYYVGCFLDVLVFSSALGYRSRQYFQEKIAAQDQLSKELERNEILLKQNQKILSRDNEMRRAQEVINFQLQNDVMAGLGSIKTYAELALNKADDTNLVADLSDRIMAVSEKSMEDISDIIWLGRIQDDIRHELITRIKFLFNKHLPQFDLIASWKNEAEILSHEEARSLLEWAREIMGKIKNDEIWNMQTTSEKISLSLVKRDNLLP